jgi:histidine ammonia-lyase
MAIPVIHREAVHRTDLPAADKGDNVDKEVIRSNIANLVSVGANGYTVATFGGISDLRIEEMTNPLTILLPAFLTPEPGLNSGFMIAQVTAAALTSENKALATPHSVDSISTSGNQEDYVSMGMSGARRLQRMLADLRHILAIELLCACQGIDLLAPLQTGALARKAYAVVRGASAKVIEDRPLAAEIEAVSALVASGTFSAILH